MAIKFCPECGTALGMEEIVTVKNNEVIIYKNCSYCEGRGYLQEIQDFQTTAGNQTLTYTCPNCGGSGKEPTDMVIYT